jgi:hypothetical protein
VFIIVNPDAPGERFGDNASRCDQIDGEPGTLFPAMPSSAEIHFG